VSQNDEARREFEAAARELVEANKRARAAGQLVSEEMHAAVEGLNEAQEKLKRVEAAHPRHYEPVALTALVNAKIDQTFSPQDRDIAKELLINECGRNLPFKAEATPQSLEQIRLAVVKLANGNLDDLRRQVQTAKSDWRDVIVAAETPEFMRIGVVEYDRLDEQSRAALRASDHKQYLDWLKLK
jgi:hypothetical protein